jgi:hypothetical protein
MRRALLTALFIVPAALGTAAAQRPKGMFTGTVRDSAAKPIAGADVYTIPGRRSVRTDSAGRYTIAGLENDAYTVTARKIGFAPEVWEARLNAAGTVTLDFTLRRRTDLDTVRVSASRTCDGLMVTGFECRRNIAESRGAVFMDYPEIDAYDQREVVDLLRQIPGMPFGLFGRVWSPPRPDGSRFRCLHTYVDGREPTQVNRVPQFTKDLVSIEIYPSLDSVPVTERKDLRFLTRVTNTPGSRRCGVIMYWTVFAPVQKPKSRKLVSTR